jgi:UPF0755 protein
MVKNRKRRLLLRSLLIILILLIAFATYTIYDYYGRIYKPNVSLKSGETEFIYIRTGWKFDDVKKMLYEEGLILNPNSFEWMAEKKNYIGRVRPGRYKVAANMSNNGLINLLRSGEQSPLLITINNIRRKDELAAKIASQLEADSTAIIEMLNSKESLRKYGVNPEQALAFILPNTYEFFWNTSAEQFLDRMHREFEHFWNDERRAKADALNLSPVEVGILASIVEAETNKWDEMSRVAGVYINRLRRGMLLQADPTARFAANDPTIRRVLTKHTQIDSPYNTYIYPGLPPGPIGMPSTRTLDKVLNYEKHDYLFFCAKDDFSGYHVFARTNAQHEQNARKYWRALNARNIRR